MMVNNDDLCFTMVISLEDGDAMVISHDFSGDKPGFFGPRDCASARSRISICNRAENGG